MTHPRLPGYFGRFIADFVAAIPGAICIWLPVGNRVSPNLPESQRKKIKDLNTVLDSAGEDHRAEAFTAIRGLIEKIVIRPLGLMSPSISISTDGSPPSSGPRRGRRSGPTVCG
jgi:hypothetical protein